MYYVPLTCIHGSDVRVLSSFNVGCCNAYWFLSCWPRWCSFRSTLILHQLFLRSILTWFASHGCGGFFVVVFFLGYTSVIQISHNTSFWGPFSVNSPEIGTLWKFPSVTFNLTHPSSRPPADDTLHVIAKFQRIPETAGFLFSAKRSGRQQSGKWQAALKNRRRKPGGRSYYRL